MAFHGDIFLAGPLGQKVSCLNYYKGKMMTDLMDMTQQKKSLEHSWRTVISDLIFADKAKGKNKDKSKSFR